MCVERRRAAKFKILSLLRRITAWALVHRLRLAVRWVPSKRNIADGPSRGRQISFQENDEPQILHQDDEHAQLKDFDYLLQKERTVLREARGAKKAYHG